ncbi:alpha/beta hydrolase [Niveispirillum sp.]|uniref:alpha/beta fold hydrolase n=1 Tax=Niveispirillum sp. TaxID=1917217 RepID=UPI001B6E9182|nr:alpha/beta hydrolase [Niveispirillum sp.]MBP7334780.1 alpha/beta hydrolase [Niveispirillum sp.]
MPYLVTSDQAKIAYDDRGSGRPLLLVHGWATHAGFFRPQMDGLSDRFRVISVDLRGHGRSRVAAGDLSIDLLARDVTELAAHLDLTDLLVVGWSMGAMVLWRALLDGLAPRVAGMVSIDMAPRVINGDDWDLGLRGSSAAKSARQTPAAMIANWSTVGPRVAGRIFAEGREADQAALRQWAEAEVAASDPVAMAQLWFSLTAQDFRSRLPLLSLPMLVTHGKLSRLYSPDTAAALAALLTHAITIGFDRSGHAPHLEEPDPFNSTLTRFAATLPPPGDGDATGAGRSHPVGAQ